MTKKFLKQLVKLSFTREELDAKKVLRFASKMRRSELREYLKYLKIQIAANRIHVLVPNLQNIDQVKIKKQFSKLFPEKKIIIEQNPELLLGVKVIDNDKIYDFNLKNSFDNMIEHFREL